MRVYILLLTVLFVGCSQKSEKTSEQTEEQLSENVPSTLTFVTNGDFGSASISLKNAEDEYFIMDIEAPGIYDIVAEDYKSNNIPKDAEIAGSSFYAGWLEVFYVERINENLVNVYYGSQDEMDTEPLTYKLFKKIDLSKKPEEVMSPPFYIINTAAVKTEQEAQKKVGALKEEGYIANYLWIPDYASLSGAEYFTVFIGPFETKQECAIFVDDYHSTDPKAYGTLVSHQAGRVTVGGLKEAN